MFQKGSVQKEPTDVVVKYKNDNYPNNVSSMDSIHTPLSLQCLQNIIYNNNNTGEQPRPISCPVCAKMIAMSSILVHFFFDHSKVPKIRVTTRKRQQILVKATDIGFETKCIAVLLIEGVSSTGEKSNAIQTDKTRPLFLLAAKLNIGQPSKSAVTVKKCIEEKYSRSQLSQHTFDKNEIVLFWTCKTDNNELISNVKLSRKDNKLSFSYTGESVYIREKQDAKNVYRNSECLIVRGEAVSNLLDKYDQMHVFVRCLRFK